MNGSLKKQVLKEPVILNPISSKSLRFEEKELDTGNGMAAVLLSYGNPEKKSVSLLLRGL